MSKGFFYTTWSSLFLTFFLSEASPQQGYGHFYSFASWILDAYFLLVQQEIQDFLCSISPRVGNSLSLVPVICESVLEGGQIF